MIVRRQPSGAVEALGADLDPLLRRIYAARNVRSSHELETGFQHLCPMDRLDGLGRAVDLLETALRDGWRVVVVGDFDADGATSSALVVRGLRALGTADVRYLVPNRFEYGYGLTPEIVAVAAAQRPELIVTVDNGISSIEGVEAARSRGIRVLVTDHHLAGERLPAADAIVNPNLPGDGFPSKHLAGVGVAFYVLLALRARLRDSGWFGGRAGGEPNLAELLDLVALGTVADVVPLDHNNRILVHQGLCRIRAGRCVPGIAALLEAAGRDRSRITAADLGFAVGPRLNAAGRLQDMSLGIECLLTDDPVRARAMAAQLDDLNRERRSIEAQMQDQALEELERLHLDGDGLPTGLCLFDERWHQGVIGILASRIKELLHRPVIAFAQTGEGELKGSARSVSGLHIRDALDAVAVRHPGLITRFGGHAMAAGLSLPQAHLERFQAAFDEVVCERVDGDALRGVIHSDGELTGADFSLELAERLRNAGPWGQGFPEPVFDGLFRVRSRRVVGERHLKLSLSPQGDGIALDAIAFNQVDDGLAGVGSTVRLAYRLDVNVFRGVRGLQLVVEHIAPP
ncbi:MAG: single-stranded-DNA-specific exonuclease RecJ [Gammaproteobacteria bacterium]